MLTTESPLHSPVWRPCRWPELSPWPSLSAHCFIMRGGGDTQLQRSHGRGLRQDSVTCSPDSGTQLQSGCY